MEIPGPRSGEARRLKGFAPVAPADIVDTAQEAAGQEPPPLIVRESLAAYLEERGLGSGEPSAERTGEGHSNITFLVTLGEQRVVLRRPPRPPIPPSAHDVLREAKVLTAVQDTAVRVPRVLAVCDDESVLGVPFYVMEEVRGTVITTAIPPALDNPDQPRRIGADPIDGPPRRGAGDRRGGDRRACRDPRRGLAGRWARGLRQAHRLPRPPAAPLQRPLGAQQDARAAARAGGGRVAGGQQARAPRLHDRARRLPPRQRDGGR